MRYIIISPVKDESKYIEKTLLSVVNQTIRPYLWVIVDDSSKDNTRDLIDNFLKTHDWIRLLCFDQNNDRQPGTGVIRAFNFGYESIKNEDFDYIVKLDCDLKFKSNYFESIFKRFSENQKLGIASGVYKESINRRWRVVPMPKYHAAGASKIIRKKCFDQIDGFVPARGWDTIDEIRAQMCGWETSHFDEIDFFHLKNEGSGIGWPKTNMMHGEIFYLTGGSKLFFLLKVMHRTISCRPFFLSGLAMMIGYLRVLFSQKKLLVSKKEAAFYRRLLIRRIFN